MRQGRCWSRACRAAFVARAPSVPTRRHTVVLWDGTFTLILGAWVAVMLLVAWDGYLDVYGGICGGSASFLLLVCADAASQSARLACMVQYRQFVDAEIAL